jgi:predicted TIM-barrel fold metal-dependent hydrolase
VIDGHAIVDAVMHPWDMSPANQNPGAVEQTAAVHAAHRLSVDTANAEYILSDDEFFTDISFDTVACAEFVESPVDLAIIHSLPNLGFGNEFITAPEKGAAFRDRHPDRVLLYGTIDTANTDDAICELERQVTELRIDGLKLYPAFFYDGIGEGWRLDSHNFAIPLLEAARDLGIKHVAIHKALHLPPAPAAAFAIDDMDSPIGQFPEIQFEMVHGGAAFLDQTVQLLNSHSNLYLTLETTFQYILTKPAVFAKILGTLITHCGARRLLFASGNNLGHPAPLLSAFERYEFPAELLDKYSIRQITAEERRLILSGNALRLHDIAEGDLLSAIRDDDYSVQRARGEHQPWSALR